MSTLLKSLETTFRSRKVRVFSRDDEKYLGYFDRMDYGQRHIVLQNAKRFTGYDDAGNEQWRNVGAVMVSHAERIEPANPEGRVVEKRVDELVPSPYATKRFDAEENIDYIKDVHLHGALKSCIPVVDINEAGLHEIIDGHKALWVCRMENIKTHPVRIVDISAKEALTWFAWDHLPISTDFDRDDGTKYNDRQVGESLQRMAEDWNRPTLHRIYPIEYNAYRLQVDEVMH